jgi:hypothetical protein
MWQIFEIHLQFHVTNLENMFVSLAAKSSEISVEIINHISQITQNFGKPLTRNQYGLILQKTHVEDL